jgi:hypothetical protein
MNVQGAAIERVLGRAILPRFHTDWSIGTVAGAGTAAVMVVLGVPVTAEPVGGQDVHPVVADVGGGADAVEDAQHTLPHAR